MEELDFDAVDLTNLMDEAEQVDGADLSHGRPGGGAGELVEAGEDLDDALVSAEFFVEMAEQTVVEIWPYLEYDADTRARVAERLARVMAKRGGEMPPWLLAYKEELQLAGVVSLVVLQTRRQIRDHERAEAAAKARESEPKAPAPESYRDSEPAPDPVDLQLSGGVPGFHA